MELRAGAPNIAELVRADDAQMVAFVLSEEIADQAIWRLHLTAELRDGSRGRVGTLTTRPLNALGAAGHPSRVIGVASCPGAVAWLVEAVFLGGFNPAPIAELGAAVAPGAARRAEVLGTEPYASATAYGIAAGVGAVAPGTDEVIAPGARVLAFSATRVGTAITDGTVNVMGEVIQVPPGSSVTVEPRGALRGPVTLTFTDCDGYVVETET